MVYFTCSSCNTTLKKNQVDQHCQYKCRGAEFVSCVDCSTDFYGNDYVKHTSCISEAQKYGGKDYTEKPSANKGQKKQDLWVQKVQKVLETAKSDDPRVTHVLEALSSYPNIPQKKGKFINFLKNTFSKYRHDQALMEKIWTLLEEAKSDSAESADPMAEPAKAEPKPPANEKVKEETMGRRKKKKKASESDDVGANENEEPEGAAAAPVKEKKKKKKKRRGDEEAEEEVLNEEEIAAMREKKWRKRDPEMEDVERLNDTLQEVEKQPKDFNLGRLITDILERKGSVSMKNLRKKALGEFWECGVSSMTEDKVLAKLDKKLRSMQGVKVINDKVYLTDDED